MGTGRNRGRKRRTSKTSSKKPFVIAGAVIAVVAVAAVIILAVPQFFSKDTPEDAVKQYFSYLSKGKYEDMYGLLSEESQKKIKKDDFITRNQNIYEGIEAANIKVKIAEKKDGQKKEEVSYKTTMDTAAGNYSFDNKMTLSKDSDRKYRIEWNTGLIFPQLGENDKVRIETQAAKRGTIYDRNQIALAKEGSVIQIGIVPGKLGDNRDSNVAQIAQLLGLTSEDIEKKLSASWVTDESLVPIKEISSSDTATEAALVGADGQEGIPGVASSEVTERVYPLGEMAGQLTGYVQAISAEELEKKKGEGYHSGSVIGKSGLERAYEKELRAVDGAEIYIADSDGNKKETLCFTPAQDGKDITVTIDAAVQQNAYQQFAADNGTAVAMNPKTGELLALVSTPGYDPNEFILGMSSDRWNQLNNDANQPMMNRYTAAWVPGSTFKPVIAAIGLDAGKINPDENKGYVGLSWQKDASWGDYYVTTLTDYGSEVKLQNALVYSDNIYFARTALDIGADALTAGLDKLGFGEEIPGDLALQESTYGKDSMKENEIQLADTGYGQGQVLVNPVHLASIYSAFVNNGNMILPVLNYGEGVTPSYWKENVFTTDSVNTVKNDMIQVIENPSGTGASAKIDGITLLGKTGTAETKASQGETGAKEYGWFACETSDEAERPIQVIAMVEDIQSKGVKHYVNDKVRNIIAAYLQ